MYYYVIAEYPNYRISRCGRIQSNKRGGWADIKPRIGPNGYSYVTLSGERPWTISHHRLVAMIFLPKKHGKNIVSHKNHIRSDNRAENLEWTDQKGNMQRSVRDGRHAHGEGCGLAKLTNDQVRQIRALYATGEYTHQELAHQFGVLRRAIGDIVNRVKWRGV